MVYAVYGQVKFKHIMLININYKNKNKNKP